MSWLLENLYFYSWVCPLAVRGLASGFRSLSSVLLSDCLLASRACLPEGPVKGHLLPSLPPCPQHKHTYTDNQNKCIISHTDWLSSTHKHTHKHKPYHNPTSIPATSVISKSTSVALSFSLETPREPGRPIEYHEKTTWWAFCPIN